MRGRFLLVTGLLALFSTGAVRAEPGVSDDLILLGQSAALTGPAALLGQEMREGANAYFEHINSQGGIHGRKIKLISYDDGYEPERSLPNTRRLLSEDKVFALFGYVGTPTSYAVLPVVNEARVPFFGAFTGAEGLRTPFNRNVFNIRASYYDETEKLVDWLVSQRKRRIAVFYQDDSYGKAGLSGVKQAMERRRLEIAALGTVERNTADVAEAVRTISRAKPDAVIMISAYKSCAAFIKQSKQVLESDVLADRATLFLNVSFVGSKALGDELGEDGHGVLVSQVVPYPWGVSSTVAVELGKLLQQQSSGREVTFNNLEGFIAAKVFVEGLRRAGTGLTREGFTTALESMRNYDAGGFEVSFSPQNHNASKFVQISIILGNTGRYAYINEPKRRTANMTADSGLMSVTEGSSGVLRTGATVRQ